MLLSTRPEKSVGTDAIWQQAEAALQDALVGMGWQYAVNEADGAFYGAAYPACWLSCPTCAVGKQRAVLVLHAAHTDRTVCAQPSCCLANGQGNLELKPQNGTACVSSVLFSCGPAADAGAAQAGLSGWRVIQLEAQFRMSTKGKSMVEFSPERPVTTIQGDCGQQQCGGCRAQD